MMKSWILTFNRPYALNRQIHALKSWTEVNIFSNHPNVELDDENTKDYQAGKIHILWNTLSDPEATSYCARSWNNIFLKCFKTEEEGIFIQDDTLIRNVELFRDLILRGVEKYDFIWGPAGDQFFYVKKSILAQVGWFDERYLGCYCGDADWLKRIWKIADHSKLSIVDSHDWGFRHNDIGVGNYIPTDIGSKMCDPTYINQHHEIEQKIGKEVNSILSHSQGHWIKKWGKALNGNGSINQLDWSNQLVEDIDWYPWFTKKYLLKEK